MNERYSKLYSLPQNLYADEMPVVISAGALLKDNLTGKVLAQLKIKNIDDRAIKALTVRLHMFDIASKPLGDSFEYQYLDLDVQRNMEFGTQTPIFLPDHTARSYSVSVVHIIFSDNEEWVNQNESCDWKQLPESVDLIQGLGDAALAEEYQTQFGIDCRYMPLQQDSLWVCACGHINHQNEEICHHCHNALADFLDPELMPALKRIVEERKHRAQERKQRKKKLIQKISCVLIALMIAIPTIVLIYNNLPSTKYKKALELMDYGNYEEAYSILMDGKVAALDGAQDKRFECIYHVMLNYCKFGNGYDVLSFFMENDLDQNSKAWSDCIQRLFDNLYANWDGYWHTDNWYADWYDDNEPIFSILALMEKRGLFSEDIKEMLRTRISQLKNENDYIDAYAHITIIEEKGLALEGIEEMRRNCIYQWSDWLCQNGTWSDSKYFKQTSLHIDATMWHWIYERFFLDIINDSTIYDNYLKQDVAEKLLSYLPASSYPGAKELKEFFTLSFREWFTNNREFAQRKWNEISILRDYVEQDSVINSFLAGEWFTADGYYYFKRDDEMRTTSCNIPQVNEPSGTKYYDIEDLIYYWDDAESNHLAEVYKFTIVDCNTITIFSYQNNQTYTLYRK